MSEINMPITSLSSSSAPFTFCKLPLELQAMIVSKAEPQIQMRLHGVSRTLRGLVEFLATHWRIKSSAAQSAVIRMPRVSHLSISSEFLTAQSWLPDRIQSLRVYGAHVNISRAALLVLLPLRQLQRLDLAHCKLRQSEDGLPVLLAQGSLTALNMSGVHISVFLGASIRECRTLEHFELKDSKASDKTLARISKSLSLKELAFINCPEVGTRTVSALVKNTTLTDLSVTRLPADGVSLEGNVAESIALMSPDKPQLKSLNLRGYPLSQTAIAVLAGSTSLSKLSLERSTRHEDAGRFLEGMQRFTSTQIANVHLLDCGVTLNVAKALATLPSLVSLTLSGESIASGFFTAFEANTSLCSLVLINTGGGDEAKVSRSSFSDHPALAQMTLKGVTVGEWGPSVRPSRPMLS